MGSTNVATTISKSKSKVGGSSKKGRQHVVHTRKYQKQKDRTSKNKEKAWSKHLAKHPKDMKAKEDIKKAKERK